MRDGWVSGCARAGCSPICSGQAKQDSLATQDHHSGLLALCGRAQGRQLDQPRCMARRAHLCP